MDSRLNFIKAQFDLHTRLYKNVVEGLQENNSQRPSDDTNHIGWLAGHSVSTRYFLANMLGIEDKEPYPELFGNGKAIDPAADYPSLDNNLKDWNSITAKFNEALSTLTPEQLDAKAPFPSPLGDTIGGMLAFLAHHEAYHIGQLGILRKYFGKEAMKYD